MNAKQQALLLFPLNKDKGYFCECCGQFVKTYCRSFNSNMGLALIILYKNRDKGFVHLEHLLVNQGYRRCGDASYLRHYKLIEPLQDKRKDGSNRNGFYKITGLGILFCEGKTKVQEKFLIFNNKLQGFAGEEISIQDTLGRKFDYNSLMQNI